MFVCGQCVRVVISPSERFFQKHVLRMYQSTISSSQRRSESDNDEIIIPKRIHRGPTDILQSLASTVGRDYTAAHYKYHDDPYLIPASNMGKRMFVLSKESGRKAARWVRDNHARLFQHRFADPPIEAFYPQVTYDEKSEVSEETLIDLIGKTQVEDAITVYELLQKKGIEVGPELRQSFLELLCFYNAEESLDDDFVEERWFRSGVRGRDSKRKTWKDGGVAESIFKTFNPPTAEAYAAIIQGMAKYYQVDRAWQLYQEAREKQLLLDLDTHNSLIRVVNFLRESSELRWKLVEELLHNIAQQKLRPNLGTLNSVLEAISSLGFYRPAKMLSQQTLAEFKQLGIQPSLASYYYLLIIFCKERGPTSGILSDILNHIEGKAFTIQDPKDTFFFVTAMDICRNHLQDKDLAYRVDKLLHVADNYNLIGDSYKESIYYRHFFALLCGTEPFEVFMEFYRKMVPHIYTPEPGIMEEVVKALDLSGSIQYLPQIWTDIVRFDHTNRESLLACVLSAAEKNAPPPDSGLVKQLADVTWSIWEQVEGNADTDRNRVVNWTGEMLGDIMSVCLRAAEFERASTILKKLETDQHVVAGVPQLAALKLYVDSCIQNSDSANGLRCIQYTADAGFPEAVDLASTLISGVKLDPRQEAKLNSILGNTPLSKEETHV